MSPSESLLQEIRASRPAATAELRERVRLVAAQEPAKRSAWESWLTRVTARRVLLVAAPATLVVALVAATAIGLTRPGSDASDGVAVSGGTVSSGSAEMGTAEDSAKSLESTRSATPPTSTGAGSIAPDPGRLQRIDAELSVRVEGIEELSRATQEAMRIVRALGGHVASTSYDATPGGAGFAQLALRVPSARVQTAVVQLSGLGTILGQRFGIQDLQETVDDLARQISETEQRIAQLRRQLAGTSLGDDERASLRIQLDEARRQLAELRRARDATRAEGQFATIQLALTTEDVLAAPGGEKDKGALDRVVDILRWEGLAVLYALVVAGPFLLLGLIAWLALRQRRRRTDTRLLAEN
ncbi:MAG: DUF4349 domain-containing protein [Actinobacteria bacterium]|nr:DUF4349 domain-containing protein [Actinomycetota bacterium]